MGNHGDFIKIESERPPFVDAEFKVTQKPKPDWVPGSGATSDEWKLHKKIELDPYEEGRPEGLNYKTLISAIVPRPIGFVSVVGKDGSSNLAPFLYFNVANHDPPVFTISISRSAAGHKDTAKDILETGELTINIISEWFIEAANYTSIDAPYGVDEWQLSGLTKAPSSIVKPPHVAESAFSIEAKLVHHHPMYKKRDPSTASGDLFIVEGVNFHVREDVINEERDIIDIAKLKPVSRLGGITYGRTILGFEIPRPVYKDEQKNQ